MERGIEMNKKLKLSLYIGTSVLLALFSNAAAGELQLLPYPSSPGTDARPPVVLEIHSIATSVQQLQIWASGETHGPITFPWNGRPVSAAVISGVEICVPAASGTSLLQIQLINGRAAAITENGSSDQATDIHGVPASRAAGSRKDAVWGG